MKKPLSTGITLALCAIASIIPDLVSGNMITHLAYCQFIATDSQQPPEEDGIELDSLCDVGQAGWTPLHTAAYYGKTEDMQILLDNDAPVDQKDAKGFTPLYYAVVNGHQRATVLLINHGANKEGNELLADLADELGYHGIAQLLLQRTSA